MPVLLIRLIHVTDAKVNACFVALTRVVPRELRLSSLDIYRDERRFLYEIRILEVSH